MRRSRPLEPPQSHEVLGEVSTRRAPSPRLRTLSGFDKRHAYALVLLVAWVNLLSYAVVRTTPVPPVSPSPKKGTPSSSSSSSLDHFRCNAEHAVSVAEQVRQLSQLSISFPVTVQVRAACRTVGTHTKSAADFLRLADLSIDSIWDREYLSKRPQQRQRKPEEEIIVKNCAAELRNALTRNVSYYDHRWESHDDLPKKKHRRSLMKFDYVVTYVNGSSLSFQERWCATANMTPPNSLLGRGGFGAATSGGSAEAKRLERIQERLFVGQCAENFPAERFRDWGEILVALRSVARCSTATHRGADESHGETAPLLPFSGRMILVVSDPSQIPSGLILRDSSSSLCQTSSLRAAADLRPRCFMLNHNDGSPMSNVAVVLVVYHDELQRGDDQQNPSVPAEELFNSNAIETYLHKIPFIVGGVYGGEGETDDVVIPWFVYGNNDMVYGRCPTWMDYFDFQQPMPRSRSLRTSVTSNRILELVHNDSHLRIHLFPRVWTEGRLGQKNTQAFPDNVVRQNQLLSLLLQGGTNSTLHSSLTPGGLPPQDPTQSLVVKFGFAHYPRVFSAPLLRWLMEDNVVISDAARSTRSRHGQRNASLDLWVPYLVDHVILLSRNLNLLDSSTCRYCADAKNNPSSLPIPCNGLVDVRPRNQLPATSKKRQEQQRQEYQQRLPQEDYLFLMIDSPYKIYRTLLERFSFDTNNNSSSPSTIVAPLQAHMNGTVGNRKPPRPSAVLPLFITINDDMPRKLVDSSGRNSDLKQAATEMNRLLNAIQNSWKNEKLKS